MGYASHPWDKHIDPNFILLNSNRLIWCRVRELYKKLSTLPVKTQHTLSFFCSKFIYSNGSQSDYYIAPDDTAQYNYNWLVSSPSRNTTLFFFIFKLQTLKFTFLFYP